MTKENTYTRLHLMRTVVRGGLPVYLWKTGNWSYELELRDSLGDGVAWHGEDVKMSFFMNDCSYEAALNKFDVVLGSSLPAETSARELMGTW